MTTQTTTQSTPDGRSYTPYPTPVRMTVGNIPGSSLLSPGQSVWALGTTKDGLYVVSRNGGDPKKKDRGKKPQEEKKPSDLKPELCVAPRFLY